MAESIAVFQKTGTSHTLTAGAFYGLIAGFTCYGLIGSAVVANAVVEAGFVPGMFAYILLGIIAPMGGIYIAQKSDSWLLSFVGYHLVLVPFGVILAPVLVIYDPNIVRDACTLTAAITVVMGAAGIMFPQVFSKLGGALFVSLIGLIVVRVLAIFIPALNDLGFIDYMAAGIFSLYIGYDMYRASTIERTLDNSVDVALSLYMDIINLFLSLLRIFGRKD
ncbi:MAG: Bax inhibitor-1 family protein [Bacteroidota bacterium]